MHKNAILNEKVNLRAGALTLILTILSPAAQRTLDLERLLQGVRLHDPHTRLRVARQPTAQTDRVPHRTEPSSGVWGQRAVSPPQAQVLVRTW